MEDHQTSPNYLPTSLAGADGIALAWVEAGQLRPHGRRARTHSRKQIEQIAESIRTFGFAVPILVDEQQRILAGNGRLEAARLLGLDKVPVVILARLAVSVQDHGRGIGFGLLQDAIRRTVRMAEQAGIRAMLTHPIDEDAARFYARFGFLTSPLREGQWLLLLKDARRWVR